MAGTLGPVGVRTSPVSFLQFLALLCTFVFAVSCRFGNTYPKPPEQPQVEKEKVEVKPDHASDDLTALLFKSRSNRWQEIPPGARSILNSHVELIPRQPTIFTSDMEPKGDAGSAGTTSAKSASPEEDVLDQLAHAVTKDQASKPVPRSAQAPLPRPISAVPEQKKATPRKKSAKAARAVQKTSPLGHPASVHPLPRDEFHAEIIGDKPAPKARVIRDARPPAAEKVSKQRVERAQIERNRSRARYSGMVQSLGQTAQQVGTDAFKTYSFRNEIIILSVILACFFIVLAVRIDRDFAHSTRR